MILDVEIKTIKSDVLTKGSAAELLDLTTRFNVFQDVENISNFKNIYLPRMKQFFDSVDALHESNQDMRECIINFDKKLSLKLNKSVLITLKQDMSSLFIPNDFKDIYSKKFDDIMKQLK